MLEQCLHLLEEAAEHEDGPDAAQKLVKVDIFFLSFIEKLQDALKNLGRVLQTKHLHDFDEVEALDA